MTYHSLHYNNQTFLDSLELDPERLLEGEKSKRLERYAVTLIENVFPFRKQIFSFLILYNLRTRRLYGLANAELCITLATLFRRFDMELQETDRSCVDPTYDFFGFFYLDLT